MSVEILRNIGGKQENNLKLKTHNIGSNGLKPLFLRMAVSCFLVIFMVVGCGFAAPPATVADTKASPVQPITVEAVCQLIYHGKFADAGKIIEQAGKGEDDQLKQLSGIVAQYEKMQARREAAREAKFKEQLAELEKLRTATESNDANGTKALTIVATACEFANDTQKKEFLSQGFVKEAIEKSIAKANEQETKGKWLDAYINCYSLLEVIDEDNQQHKDHAEKLLEKAGIVASFQDSPCETSGERFQGVSDHIFAKAISILNYNYINPVDYQEMARAGIKRCQLLSEVMEKVSADVLSNLGKPFATPDKGKLALFSSGLTAMANDMNKSMAGVSEDKFMDIFEKVEELNATTAKLPKALVIAQFAEASLDALDPYTVIVWPQQKPDFEKAMTNEFTGIGIEITKEKGVLTVASLLLDTPAYNSALDAGDAIEKVDGKPTKDMTITCAVHMIQGPAGTKVTLTIKRPGDEKTQDITLTRAKITVPTIRGWERSDSKWLYMIDEKSKIGYVRMTNFSERTSPDLENVLDQLEAAGIKGLIMDLRFNSGGYLNTAIEVSDMFLDKGTIVITRPRFWVSSTYASAHKEGTHPNYPLVILVNKYSASASEIVAGTLADKMHKRAILVGERTHGKGSVQPIVTFPDSGAQLKYTMAYYYLPSGQRVESQDAMKKQGRKDWGVGPDVEVLLNLDELKKMTEIQRDNDVLVKADHSTGAMLPKKHTLEEMLESDLQLEAGIVEVLLNLDEFKKMTEIQRDNDVLVKADHNTSAAPLKKHTLEETLESDPQLEAGILVIKTQLIERESAKFAAGSEK